MGAYVLCSFATVLALVLGFRIGRSRRGDVECETCQHNDLEFLLFFSVSSDSYR